MNSSSSQRIDFAQVFPAERSRRSAGISSSPCCPSVQASRPREVEDGNRRCTPECTHLSWERSRSRPYPPTRMEYVVPGSRRSRRYCQGHKPHRVSARHPRASMRLPCEATCSVVSSASSGARANRSPESPLRGRLPRVPVRSHAHPHVLDLEGLLDFTGREDCGTGLDSRRSAEHRTRREDVVSRRRGRVSRPGLVAYGNSEDDERTGQRSGFDRALSSLPRCNETVWHRTPIRPAHRTMKRVVEPRDRRS